LWNAVHALTGTATRHRLHVRARATTRIRRLARVVFVTALLVGTTGVADARAGAVARFPAAGELVVPTVVARAHPDPAAKVVRRLARIRPDHQIRTVLALRERLGRDGVAWYRLSLPGRPNGQRGWVRADLVDVRPVAHRIVVSLGRRTLEVRRVADNEVVFRTVVAVGMPSAPTPVGRNFYVQSGFVPTLAFYGSYALETSAYSRLTDWPGGGVVGIHGTDRPDLLGGAVSHGCVRVANSAALTLRTLAPPGTLVDFVS
jgi:lipoprotein-anchoring transpeptidase ErfK/SrfK